MPERGERMKVALVGPLEADSFADNVHDALTLAGHDVHALGAARPPVDARWLSYRLSRRAGNVLEVAGDHMEALDRRRQRNLAQTVRQLRPDLLLTIDRRLHGTVIDAARQCGALTALWFPDAVSSMGRHDMLLKGYDRIYVTNPVLAQRLEQIQGLPAVYLPEACNRRWHRPRVGFGSEPAVVVAGNIHPSRAVLLDRLRRDGIPLRIYGPPIPSWVGFPALRELHTGEFIVRERKADVFRSARVVLNNLHPAEFAGMNCRLFEAAGCGALVLTESRQGLSEAFVVGEEVDAFETYEELVGKIHLYLAAPEVGARMADAAARRAHGEHTYEHRLEWMLADLGLTG